MNRDILSQIDANITGTNQSLGDKLDALLEAYQKGQITETEYMKQVLEALNNIETALSTYFEQLIEKLETMDENNVAGLNTISSQLSQLYDQLQNNQIRDILSQIDANITGTNQSLGDKLDALLEAYQKGQITGAEYMKEVLELLNSIDSSLKDLVSQFGEFVLEYRENNEKYQQNFDQALEWMSTIDNSIKNNHIDLSDIEEIISNITINGGGSSEALDKILQAILDLKNSMGDNKPITIEELEELLKQYCNGGSGGSGQDYTEILNTIVELLKQGGHGGSGSSITIDQLEQIIKENKTDLTKVTQLMSDILNTLRNLNLGGSGGGEGGDVTINVDLSTIEGLLNELINKFDQGRIDETELLEQINTKLDNMVTVEDLDDLLNKYYSQLKADSDKHTDDILNAIKNITITGGTGIDMDALESLIAKYANNNDDVIAALDKIYEKMDDLANSGEGGSGITIRDIENLIQQYYKDPTPILTEIKNLLADLDTGDRITLDQLEQLLKENKTDLTKVTQLMSDILNALQKNSDNGVDMSGLENKINQLINAYNNGNDDLNSTLEKILEMLESLV